MKKRTPTNATPPRTAALIILLVAAGAALFFFLAPPDKAWLFLPVVSVLLTPPPIPSRLLAPRTLFAGEGGAPSVDAPAGGAPPGEDGRHFATLTAKNDARALRKASEEALSSKLAVLVQPGDPDGLGDVLRARLLPRAEEFVREAVVLGRRKKNRTVVREMSVELDMTRLREAVEAVRNEPPPPPEPEVWRPLFALPEDGPAPGGASDGGHDSAADTGGAPVSAEAAVLGKLLADAEAGDAEAMHRLSILHYRGAFGPPDRAEGFRWSVGAAEAGHPGAMSNLGLAHYLGGLGLPVDKAEAARWFKQAAPLGDVTAMIYLGMMLEQGEEMEPDLEAAAGWYRRAADQGNCAAMCWLAGRSRGAGNHAGALEHLRPAVDKGFGLAVYMLAEMTELGDGVGPDLEEAYRLYKRAADDGYAMAGLKVGLMLEKGLGVPKDMGEAGRRYLLAAEAGHAFAQYAYAHWLCLSEDGDAADNFEEALRWLKLADENGFEPAAEVMGDVAARSESLEKNRARMAGLRESFSRMGEVSVNLSRPG
jgi:TPR repeat protein